jgi:hypothetical protein
MFLARSPDEAATWPIVHGADGKPLTIPAADELRTDPTGNLYAMRQVDAQLLLRVSTDQGRSWGQAVNVVAPGVTGILKWFVAVREPGHVAVAYLGQAKGQTTWDGYLTETRDALGARPVFWSARMNDAKRPLMYGENLQGTPSVLVDYIGVDIGPDGTPWASFVQDCGPSPDDPGCTAQQGQSRGFVGRLDRSLAVAAGGAGAAGGTLPATGQGRPLLGLAAVLLLVAALLRRVTTSTDRR